ncbi:MAG: AraC family transcriptional regulator [Candidatus Thiodiazotropha sp. (ex. Lucinisca nassula)]|nr:AraC family transcriptional regulator [Candidatus Thiodiazotropha sp. (ex. Lucinisca nassula)]
MLNSTDYFADTTDNNALSRVIDDTLRSLRISGTLLLRESYTPPWSISIPTSAQLADLFQSTPGISVVAFHLVEFGHCHLKTDDGHEILLRSGEMAICFGGLAHTIGQGNVNNPQSVATLLAGGPNIRHPRTQDVSVGASMLCGVFLQEQTGLNPLTAALPPITHLNLTLPGKLHNLSGVAQLMIDEMNTASAGQGYVVERLLEVLYAQAIRAHIEDSDHSAIGWFRGIKDPMIGRAIACLHDRPGEYWSIKKLASEVAISPSRFAARFSASVGESPIAYLTKWRINIACQRIKNSRDSIENIARQLGYESQAAFSRVFKKYTSVSPTAWRAQEHLHK